jgi:hypothetical protein
VTEPTWWTRQRTALQVYAPWIGAAWGALLGMAAGALTPWPLAQTVGVLLGGLVGWWVGRRLRSAQRS